MKVKFIRDFRGRETNEMYYQAGSIVDLDPLDLIERGICVEVKPIPVKEEPAPEVKEQQATASPTKKDKIHAKNNLKSHD